MKSPLDYAPYAEAARLLEELTTGRDALEAELKQLAEAKTQNIPPPAGPSPAELALAFLRGEAPPVAPPRNPLGQRMNDVMWNLDRVNIALQFAARDAERERTQARAAAIAERTSETAAVRKKWDAARDALAAAMAAEDAFTDALIDAGFGREQPTITSGFPWLNRDAATRALNVTARYPA